MKNKEVFIEPIGTVRIINLELETKLELGNNAIGIEYFVEPITEKNAFDSIPKYQMKPEAKELLKNIIGNEKANLFSLSISVEKENNASEKHTINFNKQGDLLKYEINTRKNNSPSVTKTIKRVVGKVTKNRIFLREWDLLKLSKSPPITNVLIYNFFRASTEITLDRFRKGIRNKLQKRLDVSKEKSGNTLYGTIRAAFSKTFNRDNKTPGR